MRLEVPCIVTIDISDEAVRAIDMRVAPSKQRLGQGRGKHWLDINNERAAAKKARVAAYKSVLVPRLVETPRLLRDLELLLEPWGGFSRRTMRTAVAELLSEGTIAHDDAGRLTATTNREPVNEDQ